jgi:Spy/CpxP family protein refolding chaperone
MCHAHWAHSRPHGFDSREQFDDRPPRGWREYFMRGRGGFGGRHGHGPGPGAGPGDDDGGSFGVRRPLRFLAYKLDLDEKQVTELAKILDQLKTERAQAAVDDRRTLADFADAIGAEGFDAAKATAGGERRVASASRLKDAVGTALSQIHAMLNPDQRGRLAYMIRTGVLGL